MKNFNRDNRTNRSKDRNFGERNKKNRNRSFDNRKSDRPSMNKTICSECGNACEVPFKPIGDKPVFCSSCFRNKRGSSNLNRFGGRDSGRSNFGEKRMYSVVCSGCGNKCEVPFQPTSGKPSYCNNCFEKSDNVGNKNTEQFQKQFEMLNIKLDKILESLSSEVSKGIVDTKKLTKKTETLKSKKSTKKLKSSE